MRRPSLEELYRSYSPGALKLAYLLVGDIETARDLVHDAFVRLFGRYRDLRGPDHFEAYLRRTVINLAKNRMRRQSREGAYVARQRRDEGVSQPDTQGELRDALMQLPIRQRAVIALRYLEDLSEQQVAEIMGTTVAAVKSLTQRATASLRRALEGENR